MSYLLNLSLPLWWMFLPLVIALLLAAKLYQWQRIFSKMKANYQAQLREAQNRLDEANSSILNSALHGRVQVESNSVSLNTALQSVAHLKEVTAKLHKLETDAAEREALIVQLNKKIKDLDWLADFNNDLADSYKSLSDLKQDTIEQIQADLVAAIAVINRTKRAAKQWGKYEAAKKAKLKGQVKTIIDDGRIEGIVYDALGVPHPTENQKAGIVPESVKFVTVYKADQSENDNGRHDVLSLCDEVSRGVKEQAELIKKELASVVDLMTLEEGDSVKSRTGIIRRVTELVFCEPAQSNDTHIVKIRFNDNPFNHYYDKFGNYEIGAIDNMDIVQIIKPAKFDPQVGEKVKDAHYQNDEFYIVGKRNDEYLLNLEANGEPMISRLIQSIRPIPNHKYKNGYICTE